MAEPTQAELEAFIRRAGFTYGWENLESWARRMAERAVVELQTAPEGADSYAAIWEALHAIDTAAAMLPSFEVAHDGGIKEFTQNIIDAINTTNARLATAQARVLELEAKLATTWQLPTEPDGELQDILGTMCFSAIRFAQAARASGHEIAAKAEAEQAAFIWWKLGHYVKHGPTGWRAAAVLDLEAMKARALKEAK